VVALVTEKAEEYNRKHGLSEKPVQYLTSAVRARSLLSPEIVRHIDKCFTKKGIKEAQRGLRKRTYQPRKALIKVPPNHEVKHEETESASDEKPLQGTLSRVEEREVAENEDEQDHDGETTVEYEAEETKDLEKSVGEESLAETEPINLEEEDKVLRDVIVKNVAEKETKNLAEKETTEPRVYEEEDEEEVDDVEEYVPEEGEMKGVLEEKIFGGLLPKAVRRLKPHRKGMSERTGRGGRNETNNGAPETVVLGAVNYMLGNTADGERPTLSLSSLFGRKLKKRRKKQHITVDDLEDPDSEDDDYKGPGVRKNHRGSEEGVRKSKRLVSRRFWGDEEPQKEGILIPLEEPHDEEEEKEEFAETLTAASAGEKEEYAESVAREGSTIKVGSENSQPEEREGDGRDSRMRRGRLPPEEKDLHQEAVQEVEDSKVQVQTEDLLRAAVSRPSSQADSRPSSQNSRPGSALPAKVAKQLERVASPDRDSPVIAPRNRRLEKEERERASIDGQHVVRPDSRQASCSKSPARATGGPCDNYLKRNQKQVEVQKAIEAGNMFDQVNVRSKNAEKVRKQLEKIKKKAIKNSKGDQKKYKGFGEKKAPKEDKAKKREEKEARRASMKIKKAVVTSNEAALIAELLQTGETAVAESRQASQEEEAEEERERQRAALLIARQEAATVEEFEASQGLAGPSSLSQQLDDLFDL